MRSSKVIIGVMLVVCCLAGQGAAQSERPASFEWKQCNEDVLGLRIDPDPVRTAVGPEHTLMLEDGQAMVAIFVQDCSQYWIDGTDLGPNQMIHVLARIEGPEDVRTVVGAPHTQPTMYWFALFTGSNNPRDREARMASGTAPESIESVSLSALEYPRQGSVVIDSEERFSWSIASAEPAVRLLGVDHDVYVRDSTGSSVLKRVQAIGRLSAVPSPGVLNVENEAGLAGVIGMGRYPTMVYSFFPVWARATLGETQAEDH